MFDVLIESDPELKPRKTLLSLTISILLHSLVLMLAIVVPLFFTEPLSPERVVTYLTVPPPPPPPPATVAKITKAPKVVPQTSATLMSPIVIPKEVAMVVDEGPAPDVAMGGVGVPGGVPGGVIGGVLGGVIGGASAPSVALPPPPPSKVEAPKVISVPVPVGGRVRAPRVVKHVEPVYPPLAKAARVMGSVVLEAVLTEEGKVSNLKVVSGHPLLIGPAMDAARQWEYEPTFLNDIPARVILNITVIFRLQA
jgi:periplasmic protein TonB